MLWFHLKYCWISVFIFPSSSKCHSSWFRIDLSQLSFICRHCALSNGSPRKWVHWNVLFGFEHVQCRTMPTIKDTQTIAVKSHAVIGITVSWYHAHDLPDFDVLWLLQNSLWHKRDSCIAHRSIVSFCYSHQIDRCCIHEFIECSNESAWITRRLLQ